MMDINDIVATTRAFVYCVECKKDMQGMVEYVHDPSDFWAKPPKTTCMKCYYKDEIKELEKEK